MNEDLPKTQAFKTLKGFIFKLEINCLNSLRLNLFQIVVKLFKLNEINHFCYPEKGSTRSENRF